MKRFMEGLVESLAIFGLAVICCGGIGATCVGYLVLCDRYGVLWPSVAICSLYLLCVLLAALWFKVVKKREVPNVARDDTKPSGGSSVVKLDDLTVATAIREAKQRERTRYDNE